jgi:hypothetical protein
MNNLFHLDKLFPYIFINRNIVYKYPDVKLVIKCADEVLEKECSRLLLANMSKYFEKVFELESFTVENGIRVYKLEIPFSKKSVDESILFLYENYVESTIDVALENILTLNYFNVPFLENIISVVISNCEKQAKTNDVSEYIDQFYSALDDFQILCLNKNKNLKQRIEHLTSFQNIDTITFIEGKEVIEPNKKYRIKFSLNNPSLKYNKENNNSLEFQIDNDFVVKADVQTYDAHLPDNHYMIGISARPYDEKSNLSFLEIESISQKEFRRNVKLKFDIYNGFDDPIINAKHYQVKFNSCSTDNCQFPTLMDSVLGTRSMIGFYYPKHMINGLTFVFITIEYMD